MRSRRPRPNRENKEPILFTKPNDPVVPKQNSETKTQTKKQTKKKTKKNRSGSWGHAIKVAIVIAWYVNPAAYILFSAVYFTVGMTIL